MPTLAQWFMVRTVVNFSASHTACVSVGDFKSSRDSRGFWMTATPAGLTVPTSSHTSNEARTPHTSPVGSAIISWSVVIASSSVPVSPSASIKLAL